ncbi:MAG: tetratricopeptide repeat protein, partial [Deltaproteobacteria bacterium]|nr:tetratricopeptide repeat protein [Deltaproteobacteria bacterium]
GEYQAAIPRFQELASDYSQSLLLPRSLYLWTRCYLELGETDKAREVLETLVANFPKNGWTTKAQKHYKGSVKS